MIIIPNTILAMCQVIILDSWLFHDYSIYLTVHLQCISYIASELPKGS